MDVKPTVVDAIGNTPLIRLRRASELTGCDIYGKAEFMNPGQSVKDRPARQMILAAEQRGELKPGGLIVEATAGNTGIGLALVAAARGYRTIIVIPETQSEEKKDALRLAGATLIEVPAKPYQRPQQLPAHRPPPRRPICGAERAERRALRRPVEQPRQPHGPLSDDRAGDLAADRRRGRRLHLLGRHRRHARRHVALPPREEGRHRHRLRRPGGRGDVQPVLDRRGDRPAPATRSPRASASAARPRSSRTSRSRSPTSSPTPRRCPCSSTSPSTRGWCSAAPPASTSPAPSAWPATSAPGTPS